MRHLRSILYTLVLAPAVWILCGVGFSQDLTGRARPLSGVLLLLLAGAAYAILLFASISPLGPSLAGLAFLGVAAWAWTSPASYADAWPAKVASDGFDVSTPGYGVAVLLAVPLLCTALSARRWRTFEAPEFLLIGTVGRARVAGTRLASEQTAVIPGQRRAPEIESLPAETTQIVLPPTDDRTVDVAASDAPTHDVIASGTTPDAATREVTTDETTRAVTAGDETTRLVLPASADEEGKTQLLTPSVPEDRRSGTTDHGEQTQVIRSPTVEPPGDRTQLLTLTPPGEAATVANPGVETAEVGDTTKTMSIVGAERPDPGEDPTTRLTPPTG